jgi:hypothetical protein
MLVAILVLTCVNTAMIWHAISRIGDAERNQRNHFTAINEYIMTLSNRIHQLRDRK